MLLHQQGKLNINDLITAPIPGSTEPYIPNNANYAIPYKNQITIKMLLGHRAGVFDVADSDIPDSVYAGIGYIAYIRKTDNNHTFTFDELVGVVADNNLSYFPPNTDYHYSNTGYNLLGKIIERISDQRYDQFMQNNFLTPNSLNQTSFPYLGTDQTLPAPFETGCLYTSGILENVTIDNLSGDVAEGNIITTPANLANWIRLLVKGESGVLPNTVALMKNGFNYGFGLFQIPGLGFGHNGAHAGYLTAAFHDPDQDVTVVISASVVDWADIINEMYCLYDIGRAAKIVLGYTAPATN
jgi:D-alanyl-D-alanine carboxypeptidase